MSLVPRDRSTLMDAGELQVELMTRAERLHRYVRGKIPAKMRAVVTPEDVLQEVWIAAHSGYANYVCNRPDGFDRWLIGIANHKLIDSLKTAGRLKRGGNVRVHHAGSKRGESLTDLFGRVAGDGKTPSRVVASREAAHAVQIALSRLPDDWRKAIQLRYLEGLSLGEIARAMEKTDAAVHSILYRGLRELRTRLGDLAKFFSDAGSQSATEC